MPSLDILVWDMRHGNFEEFYQKVLDRLNIISQSKLASVLGVHRSSITQAKYKDSVPDSWILKLCADFDLDPYWLKYGTESPKGSGSSLRKVPKVRARLDAGGGSFEVSSQVESFYAFRSDWLQYKGNPEQMVLMDVMGDSMEPTIWQGDTVLLDQAQNEIYAGSIYALGVEDTVMVKRIAKSCPKEQEKHPQKLVLISANPKYFPVYLQGEEIDTLRILGRVVWMCRNLL